MYCRRRLAVKYALHPLVVEDLLSLADKHHIKRPQVDTYEDHYMISMPVIRLTQHCKERLWDANIIYNGGVRE